MRRRKIKKWKKIALASAFLLGVGLSATACSNNEQKSKSSNNITLWVNADYIPYYKKEVKQFEKENKDINVKIQPSPNGSANAKTDVAKDPEKAADVFALPHDQIGQMAEAGYINPLSPQDSKNIKSENVEAGVKAATWKGKVYAFPYTEESSFLYYNKSKLSADDVKDWDTLTSKGTVATDFSNPYYIWPVMFSAGTKLYGDSGENLTGSTFADKNGVNGLTWVGKQGHNKGVMQTTNSLNQLKKGNASAILDGPWDAANIRKILGKNFAVAPYPMVTVGGKKVQLQAFLGVRCLAVNSHASNPKAATKLARFLTNKKAQMITHNATGEIPVNKEAQASASVKNDPVAKAVMFMAQPTNSVLMPKLPQMAVFWNDTAPLLSGVYDGKIKSNAYLTQLKKLDKRISKK